MSNYNFKPLIGARVFNILTDPAHSYLLFRTSAGEFCFATDADCCSNTWVEHFSGIGNLLGRQIVSIDDLDMPEQPEWEDAERRRGNHLDVVSYYGLKFTTSAGEAVLDYRNDSNGYYGGSMVPAKAPDDLVPLTEDF